jgi:cell wall assembly regulator SMI1
MPRSSTANFSPKTRRLVFIASLAAIIISVLAVFALPVVRNHLISVLVMTFLPPLPPEVVYPPAPPMPAAVSDSMDELLSRYDSLLQSAAPQAYQSLQPGLTDAQIDQLETQYAITLPPDIRALYRWRNGTTPGQWVTAFPDHHFSPLVDALAEREALKQQLAEGPTPGQRMTAVYIAYRLPWIGILEDGFGDGYYLDPTRQESAGSFFFNFNEDGRYVFFPAFRNYLAAVLDGCQTGAFSPDATGLTTTNFDTAQTLWQKYGSYPAR